jgi:signal transduction histidine kinase
MSSREEQSDAGESPRSIASVESELRRHQLQIIERTSIPGVASCVIGSLFLLAMSFLEQYAPIRTAILGIVTCTTLMTIMWGFALHGCRHGDLRRAFNAQLLANLTGTILFFVFVDRGAILGLQTAFVGLSAGAMVLGDRAQRRVAFTSIGVVLGSAAVHETGLVAPIVLPDFVLYGAVAVAIIFGFRTPISAFRMFNEHLRASRGEALRNERLAREARDRADAQARALADVTGELREFTYVVSHDLRAPLINIDGFSAVLRETLEDFDDRVRSGEGSSADQLRAAWLEADTEVQESLHFIASGTTKMNALIDGLLELSRIDSRPAREASVGLPELLDEIVDSMQHQVRDRDISIDIGPLPEIVGERLRIGQVFGNLIENAIKYMPERAPRTISVSCEERDDAFLFSVVDSGDGIPVECRSKIFRPFKRLDSASGAAGEGLGLAAVKKIVDRQGGRIWVEDSPRGPGASFRFTWPRRAVPEPATAADSAAA